MMGEEKKFNSLTISDVSGQVIVGNHNQQSQKITAIDLQPLADFIQQFNAKLSELNLETDPHKEAEADISTIQEQLSSSRPKLGIIRDSLKTLRSILEGATGSLLATQLLEQLQQIMMSLPK